MNATLDRPLFRSLEQCLRWAWRHEPRMVAPPVIHRMVGNDDREQIADEEAPPRVSNFDLDPKPVGVDAAGQQGLLKSFVYRQPDPERLHLIAKYAHGEERRAAQRALRDYLIPLVNNVIRPRYVIFSLVAHYYGRNDVSYKDLSSKVLYLVPENKPDKQRKREARRMVSDLGFDVNSILKDIATRSEELAYSELKAKGVIA